MTGTVHIRKASVSDVPAIIEIAADIVTPAWTLQYIMQQLNSGDLHLLAAVFQPQGTGDSRIIGFAAFRPVGDDAELLQIAVADDMRRCGAGSLLLGAVIESAQKLCSNNTAPGSIFLEARAGNVPAIALYAKHGFVKLRIRKSYYDNPVEDAIVMSKTLL